MRPRLMGGDWNGFGFERLSDRRESVSVTVDQNFDFADDSYLKVFLQAEPPVISHFRYIQDTLVANRRSSFFDLVLGWYQPMLDSCPNSVLFPFGNCSWFGTPSRSCGSWSPQTEFPGPKEFGVSLMTTNKNWCPGHLLRNEAYAALPERIGDLRTRKYRSLFNIPNGTSSIGADGPKIDKAPFIAPYQFGVEAENCQVRNYFSEKLIDRLIVRSVPLYWGCPNLGDFFNMDGIIPFKDTRDLLRRLGQLTPRTYQEMLPAIEDNHARAVALASIWDRIDLEITKGLERKLVSKGGI